MAEPMLTIGDLYKIRDDHPYWPGRLGTFEFMGGPDRDVVVLSRPLENPDQRWKSYMSVKPMDVVLPLAAA
jgi:hypothetical protein